ncbi:KR-domain-containing protein [Colletotrichum eremochloae]|nr:KR-domain-containing protein [Colletotrichum eremochloae]
MKKMMLQSAHMVWVTHDDDPSLHIIDGLARCVRSENATADVRVLHLEAEPMEDEPRHIARVATAKPSGDIEFREARGQFQAARIVEDSRGDAMVAKHLVDSTLVGTASRLLATLLSLDCVMSSTTRVCTWNRPIRTLRSPFFDIKDFPVPTLAELLNTIYDLVGRGRLTPILPITAYSVNRIKEAYRTMQQGKHRGKIVLTFTPSARVPVLGYLLVGGLEGLGRSLAQLLVSCGARKLVFLSRSGLPDGSFAARDHISKLEKMGAKTHVLRGVMADSQSIHAAMCRYEDEGLPPIRGVVHLATVLRDAVFENMSHDDRSTSSFSAPPSRNALAHRRRARGLARVAVDLGIIRDVGMAAERNFGTRFSRWAEVIGIPGVVFLALMKSLMKEQQQQQHSMGANTYASSDPELPPPQVCSGLGSAETWEAHDVALPPAYLADPRFAALAGGSASGLQRRSAQGKKTRKRRLPPRWLLVWPARRLETKPPTWYTNVASEVDPSRPLYQYGVDSLVAIEALLVAGQPTDHNHVHYSLFNCLGGEGGVIQFITFCGGSCQDNGRGKSDNC